MDFIKIAAPNHLIMVNFAQTRTHQSDEMKSNNVQFLPKPKLKMHIGPSVGAAKQGGRGCYKVIFATMNIEMFAVCS